MSSFTNVTSVKIGGIRLDKIIPWSDEFKYLAQGATADRTLSGSLVVQSFTRIDGRPITFSGDDTHGWQKRSTVEALIALSNSSDSFELEFLGTGDSVVYNSKCRFRHEDPPALEFAPITPVDNPGDDFWYTGTIKLVTL